MIWQRIASGRYYSDTGGAERKQPLDVQDWGLHVKEGMWAVVVRGRSSTLAKFKIGTEEGACPDLNALIGGSDVIAYTVVSFAVPRTVKSTAVGTTLPYFRGMVYVAADSGGAQEWVDLDIYAGGKQY